MRRPGKNWISVAVWVGAIAGAGVLWLNDAPRRAAVPALVQAQTYRVGPSRAGRLRTLHVRAGQAVRAGQVLATLDSDLLNAQIVVERAALPALTAQVEAEAVGFAEAMRTRKLAVEDRLTKALATAVGARTRVAEHRAELKSLQHELGRLESAVASGLARADQFTQLRVRQQRLKLAARLGPRAVKAWQAHAEQLRAALADIAESDLAIRLRPLRAKVDAQVKRIETLVDARAALELRAPVDGQIANVLRRPGDAVLPGELVLEIVASVAVEVVAYMPEERARKVAVGDVVRIRAKDRSAPPAEGIVTSLGPAITQLPARLWLSPSAPRFGRPVHVRLAANSKLLPGELATASRTGRRATPAVSAGSQTAAAVGGQRSTTEVKVVQVPSALSAVSRLEISGAVWAPEIERFLIVSDDTGFRDRDEHSPWLFSIDRTGTFDPEPIQMEGIGRISDLESITRTADGTYYLLCSQSRSRKGKRARKRQRLIRGRLEGQTFVVSGKTAFFEQVVRALPDYEATAMGFTDALDIEGMAWHDGALLLGLKAPQARRGARILRLSNPDALFDSRGFGAGGARLLPFAQLALPTGAAGEAGGISDLIVHDGRLVVLSTLADGPARGAAWTVDLPPTAPPKRLATWPGLKPEAVAALDGRLTVFFDTGAQAPLMTRLDKP